MQKTSDVAANPTPYHRCLRWFITSTLALLHPICAQLTLLKDGIRFGVISVIVPTVNPQTRFLVQVSVPFLQFVCFLSSDKIQKKVRSWRTQHLINNDLFYYLCPRTPPPGLCTVNPLQRLKKVWCEKSKRSNCVPPKTLSRITGKLSKSSNWFISFHSVSTESGNQALISSQWFCCYLFRRWSSLFQHTSKWIRWLPANDVGTWGSGQMELILQKEIALLYSRRYAKGKLGFCVQSCQKLRIV